MSFKKENIQSKLGKENSNSSVKITYLSPSIKIICPALMCLCAISNVMLANFGKSTSKTEYNGSWNKYQDSTITYNNYDYSINDVFVVLNGDNIYFCTREFDEYTSNIHHLNIYNYYEIKTNKKICQDYDEDFYFESLDKFYNIEEMNKNDYKITLDDATKKIDKDCFMSYANEHGNLKRSYF